MIFAGLMGRTVAWLMMVVMLATALPLGTAQAALVTTEQVVMETTGSDRDRVQAFLERQDVRRQMIGFGVDPGEAAARVTQLSDAEIGQIVDRIDQLPAGQSALGAVLGVILIIFLVLLVTDLLGLTDVFPFVRR
jgi:hypothetical protein